jgi:5,10-methenyltetrahydromethanopterin hydrogenase
VRHANGNATVFDVPGQLLQPNSDLGSAGEAINAAGVIAGRWHDANYLLHGYVWLPQR